MGEESWYLSGKSEEGRIRYVWRAQVGKGARMDVEGKVRRRVGWRPDGSEKAVRYDVPESCGEGWCREGKENRVGSGHDVSKSERKDSTKKGEVDCLLGLALSPIVVRKPPNENSSASEAFSLARTPISILPESPGLLNFAVHVPGDGGSCRNVDKTSD